MVIKLSIDSETEQFVPVWTNAPVAYDFDCIEVATDVIIPDGCPAAPNFRHKTPEFSRILLVPVSLVDAQTMRNRSGLYVTYLLTPDEVRDYMVRTFLWSRLYGRKV